MSARYITTTLPYVNADPHIGFAMEILQADVLARAWRAQGEEVFFNTGVDEHGQKIFQAAEKAGESVQAYADRYATEVEKLKGALALTSDAFIRTTDPKHIAAAQEMWRRCSKDIEMREYEGLYCVGHEAFITEKELVDGKCPEHGTEPQHLKEKNYFFKFSNYQDALREYLSRPGVIVPESRRLEALKFVEGGLEDFSVSREASRLSWGIPVPGDDTQVMYVWFDALTNYLSTLGWPEEEGNFKKFWENGTTLQVAGKDQIRFQSLMWQAMLMSAGVKNTDQVFYHGFVTSGGQKMSKSIGNVISPYELVKKYGTEATRYLLLRHTHPTEDTDITWERLDEWYTANLTNGLGNLVARVMKLAEDNDVKTVLAESNSLQNQVTGAVSDFQFKDALDHVWRQIQIVDRRMNEEEPYKRIKTDPVVAKAMIQTMVMDLWEVARALSPFMPETSEKILQAVRENKKPENLFPRLS